MWNRNVFQLTLSMKEKKGDNENKTENSLWLLLGASKTKRIPSNEKYIVSTRIIDVEVFFRGEWQTGPPKMLWFFKG